MGICMDAEGMAREVERNALILVSNKVGGMTNFSGCRVYDQVGGFVWETVYSRACRDVMSMTGVDVVREGQAMSAHGLLHGVDSHHIL